MNDIDRQIREALEAEDRELFDKLDEPSLPGQVIESFRTRSRWLIAGSILAGTFMMGVCVVSGIRLAQAEEPRALVHWATVFFVAFLAVGAIKVWYWMELQRNALIRELKRLELQVARLAQRAGSEE